MTLPAHQCSGKECGPCPAQLQCPCNHHKTVQDVAALPGAIALFKGEDSQCQSVFSAGLVECEVAGGAKGAALP